MNQSKTEIHQQLLKHFSDEDLRTLCFRLEVDYADLPADGRENKARELISHMERIGKLDALRTHATAMRPNFTSPNDPDLPPATSHQPPATSHQPPATSHQPLATSHQPPATSDQSPAIRAKSIKADNIVQGFQQIGGDMPLPMPNITPASGTIEADEIEADSIVQGFQHQVGSPVKLPPAPLLTALLTQLDSLQGDLAPDDLADLRESLTSAQAELQKSGSGNTLAKRKISYAVTILEPSVSKLACQSFLSQLLVIQQNLP